MTFRAHAFTAAFLALAAFGLAACDSGEERAKSHYENGIALLEKGEPDKAQLEFRNAIKLDPSHVQAHYELGLYLKSQNDIRGALNQFRAAAELDPNQYLARLEVAEIMLVANQLDEAERYASAAAALKPDDPRVLGIKASVDYKRGKREAAVKVAREVLEKIPENVTTRLVLVADRIDSGDQEGALKLLDAGLAIDDSDLSLNVVRLGVLENLKMTDEIGLQLERLVKYFPRTDQFREALARWYVYKKKFDEAEAQYRAIAANNPKDFQRALDVARFVNAIHGPAKAREELVRLASSENPLVEYELAIATLDLREGDEAAAIERLDRLVAERTGADQNKARLERAKIYVKHEQFEQADLLLNAVITADPKNADALQLRASRYLAADENEAAIRDLRAALDVAPKNVDVMLTLASAYDRNGQRELALERLAQAMQESNYDLPITLRYAEALIRAQKPDVAENVMNEALQKRGESRDLLVALAQLKLRKQAWSDAEAIAKRLKVIDPKDSVADRLLAAAALGQRKFTESADILESVVDEGDDEGDGSSGVIALVRALLAGGDVDRAQSYLTDRLKTHPDDVTALVLRASILSSRGEMEAAEADLLKAIDIEPGNAAAYASLARIYNSMGKEAKVTETLQKGLTLNDTDVSLRLTQAMQLEFEGKFDEAIEVYEDLYKQRPSSTVIANNFASLLADHRASDPEQLQRAFNISKRFRGSDQPYLTDTYAWLLHLTGSSAEALPLLRRAADQLPTNPLVQYHLGVVLAATGEYSQARNQIERALSLSEQVNFSQVERAKEVLARITALEAERDKKAKPGQTNQ